MGKLVHSEACLRWELKLIWGKRGNFLVACYSTRFVGRSVCWSHFTFFMIFIFWPHCSCPNGLVTSYMAPAHLHVTSVALYPALFISKEVYISIFKPFFGIFLPKNQTENLIYWQKFCRDIFPTLGNIYFQRIAKKLSFLQPKNAINLHFLSILGTIKHRISYLVFELEAEILHRASPITNELVCKVSYI